MPLQHPRKDRVCRYRCMMLEDVRYELMTIETKHHNEMMATSYLLTE